MRIYKNFNEMWGETERELRHNGIQYDTHTVQDKIVKDNQDFRTKELIGHSFMVKNPDPKELIQLKNLSEDWVREEFKDRISGKKLNPGQAWKYRSNVWEEFLHGGKFSYTYPERIGNQISEAIKHLRDHPNSRHAVVTIYDRWLDHKNRGGKSRVPCSMFYQFMIRDGKVNVLYIMRSVDFGEHFPYDLVMATLFMRYVASELGLGYGDLIFFASSFHTFYKDHKEIF